MKRTYLFISVALLISLFIYLFYRTDKTVVNQLAIRVLSLQTYSALKAHIVKLLPLNSMIIYSLPEGLWIFCITLTSKSYYIGFNNRQFNCVFIPIIYCIGLEIFQLFHVTNGRFDFVDIGMSVIFWIIGAYILNDNRPKQDLFTRPNLKMMICFASYGIVYLSHVFK